MSNENNVNMSNEHENNSNENNVNENELGMSNEHGSMVVILNNLEVKKYIGGKHCINRSISSARAGKMVM